MYRTAQDRLASIPEVQFAFRGVKEQWTVIGVVGDSKLDGWRDDRYLPR